MRLPLFRKDQDFLAFEQVVAEAMERPDAPRLLAWCLMPNHWHLVVQAEPSSNLSTWMQWITVTHTHRWHAHTQTAGEGPLYQGRFKSFPIQADDHFLIACRYVEANAKRADLVERAEQWRWCSLWARGTGGSELKPWIHRWPVSPPRNWVAQVNRAMDEDSETAIQRSIKRGVPMGADSWTSKIAGRLGLDTTLRPRGRPRKGAE